MATYSKQKYFKYLRLFVYHETERYFSSDIDSKQRHQTLARRSWQRYRAIGGGNAIPRRTSHPHPPLDITVTHGACDLGSGPCLTIRM